MAVLLSIGEVPSVHMPDREIRQWRQMILHRRKIVQNVTQVKNRMRALLKNEGFTEPYERGSWWKKVNLEWMRRISRQEINPNSLFVIHPGNLMEELETFGNQLKRGTKYLDEYLGITGYIVPPQVKFIPGYVIRAEPV